VSDDKKTLQKRAAAAKALEFVKFDQIIGIGSGSTVTQNSRRRCCLVGERSGRKANRAQSV
jgi:ribose 5-phosphate isomerase